MLCTFGYRLPCHQEVQWSALIKTDLFSAITLDIDWFCGHVSPPNAKGSFAEAKDGAKYATSCIAPQTT